MVQPSHDGRSSAGLRDGGRLREAVLPMGNLLEEVFRRRWLLTAAITYYPARGRGSVRRRRHAAHGYKLILYKPHGLLLLLRGADIHYSTARYCVLTTVQYTLHAALPISHAQIANQS